MKLIAVVDLNDNTTSFYKEDEPEPVAIVKLDNIMVRGNE